MALDRIIRFDKPNHPPIRMELTTLLADYFQGIGTVKWDKDRFFVSLPGKPCHALGRLAVIPRMPPPEERWIEVWKNRTSVDVITRGADDITNALAEGLAEIIARFWQGERED